MESKITFYDIPANVQDVAWSPNTWRIRFALNYKGLAHKTIWVEYPSIEPTCKEIGAAPTGTWPDGNPMYTLPAINDPRTGTTLADSMAIARYLDEAYPDTPRIIPAGTEALHEAFQVAMNSVLLPHFTMLVVHQCLQRMHPESAGHYKRARESEWGGSMEEWSPVGSEVRRKQWEEAEKAFGKMQGWKEAGGKKRRFFMGEEPSFADFIVAARLMWMKKILGEESEEWLKVEQWDGGRWADLLTALAPYSEVKV